MEGFWHYEFEGLYLEGPGLIHGGAYFWNIKVLCPYYNMNCTPLGPKYYQYFLPALITLYVRNSIIMRMLLVSCACTTK